MAFTMAEVSLYIIIGILAAIAYSLRKLYHLELQISRMDKNIQRMLKKPKRKRKR